MFKHMAADFDSLKFRKFYIQKFVLLNPQVPAEDQ